MTRMSQEINDSSQKTPENTVNDKTSTPRTPINASVNVTSHSSVRAGINTPSPSVTGASATKSTPKSPAVDSTKKKTRIEPNFNYDSESESNSDQQEWKDNVQNATSYRSSSTYRKRMTEEDWGPPISERDLEGLITESSLERTNRFIQDLQRRQEAEARARSHSPTTPRQVSRDTSTSRNSSGYRSAERNGAQPRTYSGNSADMERDYSSGQEYFSAGEEEK